MFGWYRFEVTGWGSTGGYYLTGFGTTTAIPPSSLITEIALLEVIGGLLVTIGSIICIVANVKESKGMGVFGGLLILLGPILLVIDFLVFMSDYAGVIGGYLNIFIYANAFWDSISSMGYAYTWGVWIGFFVVVAGGVSALIGGLAL